MQSLAEGGNIEILRLLPNQGLSLLTPMDDKPIVSLRLPIKWMSWKKKNSQSV